MRRTPRALVVAAMVAAALAGCSGDDAPPPSDPPPPPTGTTTPPVDEGPTTAPSPVPSPTPSASATEDAAATTGGDDAADVVAAAAAAGRGRSTQSRFRSTALSPQGALTLEAEGVTSADGEQAQYTVVLGGPATGGQDVDAEVRLLDDRIFQRTGGGASQLPAGLAWQVYSATPTAGAAIAEQLAANAPAQQFAVLARARDVREVGPEQVEGVATTRYDMVVDRDVLLDARVTPATGAGDVAVSAWVDGEGLVRRVASGGDDEDPTLTATVDVLAYDVEVAVEAPPPDTVVEFDDLGP